jgi:hypothetical protein
MLLARDSLAQHKLYFSDVLDRGQGEVELTLSAARGSAEVEGAPPTGRQTSSDSRASYLIGWAAYGLADGLELGVAVPYFWKNETTTSIDGGPGSVSGSSGLGDVAVRLKYLLHGSRQSAGMLAVRASLLLDTADEGLGSGTNAVVLGLYGTLRVADWWRPYATVSVTERGSERSNVLSVLSGIYYARSEAWFIDFGGTWSRQGEESNQGSVVVYSLQVSGAFEITRRWYLRPSISTIRTRDFSLTNPDGQFTGGKSGIASLGMYRLF